MGKTWTRKWFTREMPLGEDTPLTASFEFYKNGIIGIHLSNCYEDGVLGDEAVHIINVFESRTELDGEGGIYIFVRGELPYVERYAGVEIDTYYLTGEVLVYADVIENQDAIDWFFAMYDLSDLGNMYVDTKYYRQVSMSGDHIKISVPRADRGTRHKTLLSYGGKLINKGLTPEQIEIKMYDFNMLYCAPPLSFDDFQSIVKSVKKYSKGVDTDG